MPPRVPPDMARLEAAHSLGVISTPELLQLAGIPDVPVDQPPRMRQRLTPHSPQTASPATCWARLGSDAFGDGDTATAPLTEPEHTVQWAVQQMRRGCKMTREAWPRGSMLWIQGSYSGLEERLRFQGPGTPTCDAELVVFTVDDIEATDWTVVT